MPIYKCESSSVNPQTFPLDEIVMGLREARFKWRADQNRLKEMGGRHLPSPHTINEALELVIGALFPMRLGPNDLLQENEDFYVGHTIGVALNTLLTQVRLEVRHQHRNDSADPAGLEEKVVGIVREFARKLPGVRRLLDTDVYAAYSGDPAAKSVDEVLLCYPGVLAMVYHRLAHCLYTLGVPWWRALPLSWRMARPALTFTRGANWRRVLYRPRNRRGHRGNRDHRRTGAAVSERDPGRQEFSNREQWRSEQGYCPSSDRGR